MARLLLVDDDYDIRELGRALLVAAGHEVETTDSAMNAMAMLRANAFDLLISDVNMPNCDGFDFLKMIRLEGRWPRLIKVMLTGRRDHQDVKAAAREGVAAYIVKPLEPEQFIEKIESLLLRDNIIPFPSVDFSMVAEATVKLEIKSISEVGLVLVSPYQFRSGLLIPVNAPIFQRIGIPAPLTRVFTSQKKDGEFETRVTFVDLNDSDTEKLRTWAKTYRAVPHKRKGA